MQAIRILYIFSCPRRDSNSSPPYYELVALTKELASQLSKFEPPQGLLYNINVKLIEVIGQADSTSTNLDNTTRERKLIMKIVD